MLLNPFRFAAAAGGYIAPVVLSAASAAVSTSLTSHAIPLPAVVNAGDLLILTVTSRSTGAATVPAGWTAYTSYNNTNSSPGGQLLHCYKDATGSEGGTSVTVTLASTSPIIYNVLRIQAGTFSTTHPMFRAKNTAAISASSASSAALKSYPGFPTKNSLSVSVIGAFDAVGGYNAGYSFADNRQSRSVGSTTATASALEVSTQTNGSGALPPLDLAAVALSTAMPSSRWLTTIRGYGAPVEPEVSYQAAASFSASAGNSLSITVPATAKVGDKLVIACMSPGSCNPSATGWTSTGSSTGVVFLTKTAVSGDIGASHTVTFSASNYYYSILFVFRSDALTTSTTVTSSASGSSTTPYSQATGSAAFANKKVISMECVCFPSVDATNHFTSVAVDREALIGVFNNSISGVMFTLGCKVYTADASGNIPNGSYTLDAGKSWNSLRLVMG